MDNSMVGKQLEDLFNLFTTQLLKEVQTCVDEGIPIAAADKAAIIRFLQLNNVVYTPQDNDELARLREQLISKQKNGNSTALAALRECNDDIEAMYNTSKVMQ